MAPISEKAEDSWKIYCGASIHVRQALTFVFPDFFIFVVDSGHSKKSQKRQGYLKFGNRFRVPEAFLSFSFFEIFFQNFCHG